MFSVCLVLLCVFGFIHAIDFNDTELLEIELRAGFGDSIADMFFQTEDWINHEYVYGSPSLRKKLLDSGLQVVCCTRHYYRNLACAVTEQGLKSVGLEVSKLITALTGGELRVLITEPAAEHTEKFGVDDNDLV